MYGIFIVWINKIIIIVMHRTRFKVVALRGEMFKELSLAAVDEVLLELLPVGVAANINWTTDEWVNVSFARDITSPDAPVNLSSRQGDIQSNMTYPSGIKGNWWR